MRVAVLSDIHANLASFRAVLAHLESSAPDVVVVGGDVINRGPQPRECLEIVLRNIREHGWRIIKGNHEDYVLHAARGVDHLPEWERMVCAHSLWTARLVPEYLSTIASWPDHLEVETPEGSHLTCFHASRKGNRVGLYHSMHDDELLEHVRGPASAICVGHTHVPFIRHVAGKLIVNCGAVGMPFDGNPAASYALLDWTVDGWTAEIVRIPYDRQETLAAFQQTGYATEGGLMVKLIMQELKHASPWLGKWHVRYEKAVASGTMSLAESVEAMLGAHA